MNEYRRKTPEELLRSIAELHRGKLKVYIGAFAGSGKTYHMLREGHELLKQGVDVVYCAVTTSGRPETMQQLAGLERIPSLKWMKKGTVLKDMDISAIIARNPEVVLTDGLAHRNQPGAPRASRLEDIRYLLANGISVIVTVNAIELEGARLLAMQKVELEAADTVPDDVLASADEVRLIDVSPETMLKRIANGSLRQELPSSLYKRGNLAILREIALRLMAEGVIETLEKHREEEGLTGPSGVGERILVAAQYHWNGSIYVRRGHQIAKRLNGELTVVAFVRKGVQPSREEESYRQSMRKLCHKLNAPFSELPLKSRRGLPRQLLDYAESNQVTRIVLGHSKRTRWQEWRGGSVIHSLISKARGIDLFIVADRAELDGERMLPARNTEHDEPKSRYRRLSGPEIEKQARSMRRGRFKVYLGAAPGAGKTYAMLREGNSLLAEGVDVVIGLLETHGRKETAGQVGQLAAIPLKRVEYRGTVLHEMDLEAILQRRPEVVLVDELAHTNVPGSAYKKRYEAVQALLDAGISVISTMNVQHLESLIDAVAGATGVRVRETVPDNILGDANEVVLIDAPPSLLRQRLKDGKIYALEKVEQSLTHFFREVNLIALRELALREVADDVDERLEAWQRNGALRGPWRRKEAIGVFVSLGDQSESLIRRGFRIAHRLKANWHTVYIEAGISKNPEADKGRVEAIQALTERLGGSFMLQAVPGARSVGREIVKTAQRLGCSQLVLGQPARHWYRALVGGSIMKTVMADARSMDVLVVGRNDEK